MTDPNARRFATCFALLRVSVSHQRRRLAQLALLASLCPGIAASAQPQGEPLSLSTGDAVSAEASDRDFGADVAFLREHVETLVLSSGDSRVAVVPAYQGRVMTSSSGGDSGASYGWINYEHIASGEVVEHINVYGGEERFWLGPEGGQFSVFFAPGAEFDLSDWQTPAVIDSEPFETVERSEQSVLFRREARLVNYSKAEFEFRVDRRVEILTNAESRKELPAIEGSLRVVAYRTTNRLSNTGEQAWNKETGLLSIWLLGMYKPSAGVTVVVPFVEGPEETLGPIVNDAYFGPVPPARLKVGERNIYFSGDGSFRSKIGLSPRRATDLCGSYDPVAQKLTVIKFTKPSEEAPYVNSMWEIQDEPFSGDLINAYNDGPPAPGKDPLGPFYELESSSPALALGPGESAEHVQETFHITGPRGDLNRCAVSLFGVTLNQIESALE